MKKKPTQKEHVEREYDDFLHGHNRRMMVKEREALAQWNARRLRDLEKGK